MSDTPTVDPTSWIGQLTGTPAGALAGVSPQMFLQVLQDIVRALNAQTAALNTLLPLGTTILAASSVALPVGAAGTLHVSNTTGAPITITLPTSPTLNQSIAAIDIAGNAAVHTITFNTADASLIEGNATYDFVNNYQAATFVWNGVGWSVL